MAGKRRCSETDSAMEDDSGLVARSKKRGGLASLHSCVSEEGAKCSSIHLMPHGDFVVKADLVADSDRCGSTTFEGFSGSGSTCSEDSAHSDGSSGLSSSDASAIQVSTDSFFAVSVFSDTDDRSSAESGDILVLDSRIPEDSDLRVLASIINVPHSGSRGRSTALSPVAGRRPLAGRTQAGGGPQPVDDGEPLDTFADSDSDDIVFRSINARLDSRYYTAGMLFPRRVPALSSYEGPVRRALITEGYIERMAEKIRRIEQHTSHSEMQELIRGLSHLGSVFSREEVYYIRGQTRETLVRQEHGRPDLVCIITYVYEWACGNKPEVGRPRRHYPSVRHASLIDNREGQCTICCEGFRKSSMCVVMDCMHVFHSRCLGLWLRESQCCPTCRACPKR